MIRILKKITSEKVPEELNHFEADTWIHIEEPTDNEIERIVEAFKLDKSLLQDALDIDEVPRMEIEDDILYIYTRYVLVNQIPADTTPLLIIITKQNLITLSLRDLPIMTKFLSGKIDFNTSKRSLLIIKLFRQINETYSTYLNSLTKKLRSITASLEKISAQEIIQFVTYESILYDFNSTLLRISPIYRNFMHGRSIKLNDDEKDYAEDLLLESEQLVQITNENLRVMVNIRDAYSTVTTNNLNRVIKLFTSLTVILTIPTIFGTFFGMNVGLPLANQSHAFAILVIASLVISLGFVVLFKHKDWL